MGKEKNKMMRLNASLDRGAYGAASKIPVPKKPKKAGEEAYGPDRTKAVWNNRRYPLPAINTNRMKNKMIKAVFDNLLDNVRGSKNRGTYGCTHWVKYYIEEKNEASKLIIKEVDAKYISVISKKIFGDSAANNHRMSAIDFLKHHIRAKQITPFLRRGVGGWGYQHEYVYLRIVFCDGEEQWWFTETNGPDFIQGYRCYEVPAPDRVVDLRKNEKE